MVIIELGNGKTVMIKLEDWLNITDEQFQDLIARNEGYEIDNPFDKVVDRIRDLDDKKWEEPIVDLPDLPEELSGDQIKQVDTDGKET